MHQKFSKLKITKSKVKTHRKNVEFKKKEKIYK